MPQEGVVPAYGIIVRYCYYYTFFHKFIIRSPIRSGMTICQVKDDGSDGNDTGNVRMRIIVHEFKVLVLEIEYALHFRIYLHLRQLARLA